MDKVKVIFFDMGNTLLHFHYGKSDDEKDMQGLIYLTEYLNKFNTNIKFIEVKQGFYQSWMEGIKDRKVTLTEYPIEDFLNNFLQKHEFSYSLKIGKPNKQIFKTAIETMKITPVEAVMVSDNLESDIKPALDLGMKTIWLNHKNNNVNNEIVPHIEISCISELPKYI